MIKIRKTMALLQKIVATGNGQPPESPFYYPDKIKVQGNRYFTKLNYKRIGVGQGEVHHQKEIATLLDGSKSKVRSQRKHSVAFG